MSMSLGQPRPHRGAGVASLEGSSGIKGRSPPPEAERCSPFNCCQKTAKFDKTVRLTSVCNINTIHLSEFHYYVLNMAYKVYMSNCQCSKQEMLPTYYKSETNKHIQMAVDNHIMWFLGLYSFTTHHGCSGNYTA